MAQQISDVNIRKTQNKQYILPHTLSEQNATLQHHNTSKRMLTSPCITSQDADEAEKVINQTLGIEINESEYLLLNTLKMIGDREVDIGPRQNQGKTA